MPEHLRDAVWRVESAQIASRDTPGGLIVAGMGGSAMGGLLAAAVLGDRASRPLRTVRAYELPAGIAPDTTVLCASYSGNTEETLACYEAAGALGARRIAVTTGGRLAELARADKVPVVPLPGGFQPRAAIAYATVVALEIAALCGTGPSLRSEVDVAAARLEELVHLWRPESAPDSQAKALAHKLNGRVPVIAGAGLTTSVAYRWKCQANENAKLPAFYLELPELDHNDIVGWDSAADFGRFAAVFLADSDLHPRVHERITVTERLIAETGTPTAVVETQGDTPTERLFSLVLLGDLLSLYLAALRGVDPGPVEAIDRLKDELG